MQAFTGLIELSILPLRSSKMLRECIELTFSLVTLSRITYMLASGRNQNQQNTLCSGALVLGKSHGITRASLEMGKQRDFFGELKKRRVMNNHSHVSQWPISRCRWREVKAVRPPSALSSLTPPHYRPQITKQNHNNSKIEIIQKWKAIPRKMNEQKNISDYIW